MSRRREHLKNYLWSIGKRYRDHLAGASVVGLVIGIASTLLGQSLPLWGYLSFLFATLFGAVFFYGLDLHVKAAPILEIRPQPIKRDYIASFRVPSTEFYFEVRNKSQTDGLNSVRVKLIGIQPECDDLNFLPVPLHIKHNNESGQGEGYYNATEFDLSAGEAKYVDLV